MDKFKVKRWKAVLGVTGFSVLLGIPSAWGFGLWSNITILGMDFLSFFDFLANSILMPIVALLTCILIGWVVKTKTLEDEITKNGEKFSRRGIFHVMVRYIAPVFLIMILVFYTLAQFGLVKY
jgi:NSS family neurotransmitter:Na+ symporter